VTRPGLSLSRAEITQEHEHFRDASADHARSLGHSFHLERRKEQSKLRVLDFMRAWWKAPQRSVSALAVEITRKCPVGCPRCDANAQVHFAHSTTIHRLNPHDEPETAYAVDFADLPADELVFGVLEAVDRFKAQHLLLTGGEPLIRHRELKRLIPLLLKRGIRIQLATGAFRNFPHAWTIHPNLKVVVAIHGLQPEHDAKRAPATYKRILCNIAGQNVTIHCTVTGHMMKRPGYLKEFLDFWTVREEVKNVCFSLFTPQKGQQSSEALTADERKAAISDMLQLRLEYPKLDMSQALIKQYSSPPKSPAHCALARNSTILSADLKSPILPCPFGGDPDCLSCGYFEAMQAALDRKSIFWEKPK
jgi:organic radical activating enzyme